MSSDHHHHRRGMAMLLVMISVAMATILATAYLASRDNSIPISRNAAASARARWAALSAEQTALAVLQTETAWRSKHKSGVLLDDYALAGAAIRIEVRDVETNAPPTATTRYVKVTAIAKVDEDGDGSMDGREQASILAYVPVITDPYAVVDLSDFAVFASDGISLSGNATIARWPLAPLSVLGRRINLGTHAMASGTVSVLGNAACIDCTLYREDIASATLLNVQSGPPIAQEVLLFPMQFPVAPAPGVPLPAGTPPTLTLSSGSTTISNDSRYWQLNLSGTAHLTLQGNITFVVDQNLTLLDTSRLYINGQVKLVVFNDAKIRSGTAIELRPGASLKFFCRDDLELLDAYIGEQRPDNVRDHTGYAAYTDVGAIQIFTIDPDGDPHLWYLHGNSVVKGSIYGTGIELDISSNSALYGRAAVQRLTLANNSAVFYDSAIDERQGFTNPQSPMYTVTDDFNAAFALGSLDPSAMQTVANTTGAIIQTTGEDILPMTLPLPPLTVPGEPTPRPVQVDYTMDSFGVDMKQWEQP